MEGELRLGRSSVQVASNRVLEKAESRVVMVKFDETIRLSIS